MNAQASGDLVGEAPSAENPAPPAGSRAGWTSDRVAFLVFCAYIAVAFPLLLKLGSGYWFYGHDDWGLFTEHSVTNLGDLFRPQHAHWSTVPILVYHGLYQVVGLHSYLPYQVAVVGMHLTLACLIRAVMRRVGVAPWVATVTAASIVLYAPGEQNILSAVQVSMVGSMVFGFTHLLLADHDGPVDRRDWIGLAAGALGLMSSGIGVVLVVVVGLAVVLRRGWKLAVFHTVPLAGVLAVWYLAYRSDISAETANNAVGQAPASVLARWLGAGESGVLLGLGYWPVLAVAIAVLGVVGLGVAWIPLSWSEFRRRAAAPLASMLGSVVLFVVITNGRWVVGDQFARSSRYIAMGTAFLLPALGVAADAVIRWWRATCAAHLGRYAGAAGTVGTTAVLALFVIPMPPNATSFGEHAFNEAFYSVRRQMILGIAASPLASRVPRDVYPDPDSLAGARGLTVGFLLDAKAAGKVPDPPAIDPLIANEILVRLSIPQSSTPPTPAASCHTEKGPVPLNLPVGSYFRLSTPILVTPTDVGSPRVPVRLDPAHGAYATVRNPDLRATVTTESTYQALDICTP